MAYREVPRMEIGEVIRRWQAGHSRRQIAASTGLSRDTVAKYLAAAVSEGIAQEGPVPGEEQLRRWPSTWRAIGGPSGPARRRSVGPRQRPAMTCWSHGRTRSTNGSQQTGCR